MSYWGYFFDALIRQEGELDEEHLNPEDNCEEFGLLTEADCRYYEEAITAAFRTQRAVVATLGGLAFGDIAMVPAPGLKHPRGVRDVASWYMATVANPDFIKAVFEHQLRIALRTGSILELNMSTRLGSTRYYPLRDEALMQSVTTDGENLLFGRGPDYEVQFSIRMALLMAVNPPAYTVGSIIPLEEG